MVSHRLSCIQIQSYKALDRIFKLSNITYKALYRRWFHIGCHAYRYNLIRLYTEDGFHIGCHAYRYNLIRL